MVCISMIESAYCVVGLGLYIIFAFKLLCVTLGTLSKTLTGLIKRPEIQHSHHTLLRNNVMKISELKTDSN